MTVFEIASMVALVKVEAIEPFGGVRALASIEEVFSGLDAGKTHVILIGDEPGLCSQPLRVGSHYLVFGRRISDEEEAFGAGACTARLLAAPGAPVPTLEVARELFQSGARSPAADYLRRVAASEADASERNGLLRSARALDQANQSVTQAAGDAGEGRTRRALQSLDALEEVLGDSHHWWQGLDEEPKESVRQHLCPAAQNAFDAGRLVESLHLALRCRSIVSDFQPVQQVIDGLEARARLLDQEAEALRETDPRAALAKWREALSLTADNSSLHRELRRRHPSLAE